MLAWICVTGCFVFLVSFCSRSYCETFYLVTFVILFLLLLYPGADLDYSLVHLLGASSYAIYLLQFPFFHYFKKAVARGWFEGMSAYWLVVISVFLCTIAGIGAHFTIEKPGARLLDSFLQKRQAEEHDRSTINTTC